MKKALIIVGIGILVIAIANIINPTEKEAVTEAVTAEPAKEWHDNTYEEKQKLIEAYLQNPNDAGYALIPEMQQRIKNKLNYPLEAKFIDDPLLFRGNVIEADSGWVHIDGTGTTKNGFGVKSKFYYTVKLKITDKEVGILDVNVSE